MIPVTIQSNDVDNHKSDSRLPGGFWSGVISLAALKLWLVSAQRLCALPHNLHDDELYIRLASYISHGQWLGSYDSLTLAKRPFYSLWLVINFWIGTPLVLSQNLLYILGCMIAVLALRPLLKHWFYLLLIFAVLLFNPGSFSLLEMLRVAREGIYPALTLIVAASAVGLVLRMDGSFRKVWTWVLGLGVSFTTFWLTREEGVWIFPTLGLLAVYGLFKITPLSRKNLAHSGLVWGMVAVLPLCGILVVSWLNWNTYGLFATTESDDPAFKAAYGAMTRVKGDQWLAHVPVSHQVRRRIYRVSPAFSELRPFLEGEIGEQWAVHGVNNQAYEGEIQGGWYMWALRDAVSAAGYYSDGRYPQEYYTRVAREINQACQKRRLDCYPERSSMMPPWNPGYMRPFSEALLESWFSITRFRGLSVAWNEKSLGSERETRIFQDLTREELCRANEETVVSGKLFSENKHPKFILRGFFNEEVFFVLKTAEQLSSRPGSSPDSQNSTPGSPFVIHALCPYSCTLVVDEDGDDPLRLDIQPGIKDHWVDGTKARLYIQSVSRVSMLPMQEQANQSKLAGMRKIVQTYQNLVPGLMLLAMLAYAYLGVRWLISRRNGTVWWIATSVLVGVLVRIALVSLLEVTSFPAITTVYLSPAYPLMLLFIGLVLISALRDLVAYLGSIRISKLQPSPPTNDETSGM